MVLRWFGAWPEGFRGRAIGSVAGSGGAVAGSGGAVRNGAAVRIPPLAVFFGGGRFGFADRLSRDVVFLGGLGDLVLPRFGAAFRASGRAGQQKGRLITAACRDGRAAGRVCRVDASGVLQLSPESVFGGRGCAGTGPGPTRAGGGVALQSA